MPFDSIDLVVNALNYSALELTGFILYLQTTNQKVLDYIGLGPLANAGITALNLEISSFWYLFGLVSALFSTIEMADSVHYLKRFYS